MPVRGHAVALFVALLLASPALSARLPDWADGIAEDLDSLPAADPAEHWRVLFSERHVTVEPDGAVRTVRREARQALSDDVRKGFVLVQFDARTRIRRLRAWHAPPGERRAKRARRRDAVDVSVGESFLGDAAARVLPIKGIKRGSIVFLETVTVRRPYRLTWLFRFGRAVPVLHRRVIMELSEGFSLQSEWLRVEGPAPRREGRRFVWELTNLPGERSEPLAPPSGDGQPVLAVAVAADDGRDLEMATFRSWDDLGRYASELVRRRQAEGGRLEQWAASGEDPLERLAFRARHVRDRIRYVSVALDTSGWEPRDVAETLQSGWGDCKDKATLLTAALAQDGLVAWPVLVNLTERDLVPRRVPVAEAFNHMIVAIAVDGLDLDEQRFGGALGDGGELGRLLFFDPTDVYVPLGRLSAALVGKRALVAAGDHALLVTLPGDDARWHVREALLEGNLAADDALSARWTGRYRGEPARIEWSSLRASTRGQRGDLERTWRDLWPRAGAARYDGRMDEQAGEFVEEASFEVPPPSIGRRRTLPLVPMPGWWLPHPRISSRRKVAVEYHYPRTLVLRAEWRGLDESWVLPHDVSRSVDGARARAVARRREDGVVEVTAKIILERRRFEPDALRDLRRFLATCRAVERFAAVRPEEHVGREGDGSTADGGGE